ncbi:MAG: thioesterase family protein [Lautropia sp.]
MPDAYFTATDDAWFVPTDYCRGPWDADSCHAGPPSGLLARAMERALASAGSGQRLVRIAIDLERPVPMAGFSIRTEIVRAGRSMTTLRAILLDGDAKQRCVANGLALRADLDRPLPTAATAAHDPQAATPGGFVFDRTVHGLRCFTDSVEMRYPPGEDPTPGPTSVWMRSLPLLAHETPSPMQRICPLADCGNALSRNAEPWDVGFVNADLTLVLHREPDGEWLGSRSVSHWQPGGIGLSSATLFDRHGDVGHALQTLLLRPAV